MPKFQYVFSRFVSKRRVSQDWWVSETVQLVIQIKRNSNLARLVCTMDTEAKRIAEQDRAIAELKALLQAASITRHQKLDWKI